MNTESTNKYRELEERTATFAKQIIRFCQQLPKSKVNDPLISQIVRSSGSVGANYRDANEALGKKDLLHRLRIARKEAKETHYWLELIEVAERGFSEEIRILSTEAQELRNILSAIILKIDSR
ncbi:MAG: four helix bundle protein [Candidatus Liptonbacteria bacterium]|nr:four helix bundle protein [Candidatus Liptonbacteria bacterium]